MVPTKPWARTCLLPNTWSRLTPGWAALTKHERFELLSNLLERKFEIIWNYFDLDRVTPFWDLMRLRDGKINIPIIWRTSRIIMNVLTTPFKVPSHQHFFILSFDKTKIWVCTLWLTLNTFKFLIFFILCYWYLIIDHFSLKLWLFSK